MSYTLDRRKVAILALVIMVIITALGTVSYAKGGLFDDFDVNMGKDGNVTVTGQGDANSAWKTVIDKYKNFITGVSAIGAVTMLVLFIVQFMKLGASAGNAQARSNAITGCLWTGLATAGLGAVSLITGIFYGGLK